MNKQNLFVIDYDYIESNHDYNRDYIYPETSSERKQNSFAWFDVSNMGVRTGGQNGHFPPPQIWD